MSKKKSRKASKTDFGPDSLLELVAGDDNTMVYSILSFLDNHNLYPFLFVCKRFYNVAWKCIDPSANESLSIHWASQQGYIDLVRLLLQDTRLDPRSRFRIPDNYGHSHSNRTTLKMQYPNAKLVKVIRAFEWCSPATPLERATKAGHIDIIRLLLQDDRALDEQTKFRSIEIACIEGHDEIARLLNQIAHETLDRKTLFGRLQHNTIRINAETFIQLSQGSDDPSLNDNRSIRWAIRQRNGNIIEQLLQDERVDPSAGDSEAIISVTGVPPNFDILKLLLLDGRIDPSIRDNAAIIVASRSGKIEIVKLLLQDKRVDPSARENEAIRLACKYGHTQVSELLLQDERVDPSAMYNHAIRLASSNGHTQIVELLLQDERVNPTAMNNDAIRLASQHGHVDVVKLLLNDGFPRNIETGGYFHLLHFVDGNVDPSSKDNTAKTLDKGRDEGEYPIQRENVDPSAEDNEAIRLASENGHIKVVELLLQDQRVDPTTRDNEAIRSACRNGRVECVKLLLKDKRVDPSAIYNQAIRLACKHGHIEVVKLLVQQERVDPSAGNNESIRMASNFNHSEIVSVLLQDKRVNPSARDNEAIRVACMNHCLETIQVLLRDRRVDPAAKNNEAMIEAARGGCFEVIEILLQSGRINTPRTIEQAIRDVKDKMRSDPNGMQQVLTLLDRAQKTPSKLQRRPRKMSSIVTKASDNQDSGFYNKKLVRQIKMLDEELLDDN